MNTDPNNTSPNVTVGKSPVVTNNDLKPQSNEVPSSSQSSTAQNKDNIIKDDLESYPKKYRPLIKAILQLSDNRPNSRVGFEAVQKLVGDVKALNVGLSTFATMVRGAVRDKYVDQGDIQLKSRWLTLLPVCLVALVSYYCNHSSAGRDHEHWPRYYVAGIHLRYG
jgi:hypothetical protein